MCFGHGGIGGLFSSGGGLIGGLLADVLFPEIGIPATIAGAALGSTGGGLLGGEDIGTALEGGLISGATAGIGSALLGSVGGISGIGDALGFGGSTAAAGIAPGVTAGETALGSAGFGGGTLGTSAASAGGPAVSGVEALSSAPLSGGGGAAAGGGFNSSAGDLGAGGEGGIIAPATSAGGGFSGGNFGGGIAPTSGNALTTSGGGANFGGGGDFGSTPNITTAPATGAGGGTVSDSGFGGGGGGDFGGGGDPGSAANPNPNWLQRLFGSGGTPGVAGSASGTSGGIGDGILKYLGNNPGTLLGGGLLGVEALTGGFDSAVPGSGPLKAQSAQLQTLGNQEVSGLQTGQVPAGAQALLDQAKNAMRSHIRSSFANMGLPTGSTMEAQQMAQVDQMVEGQKWSIISDLLKQGTSAIGASAGINEQLMAQEIAKEKSIQDAISRFAASLAGGGARTNTAAAA